MDLVSLVRFPVAFTDQRPGTSGLRKRVRVFQQEHYTEAFVSSIFHVLPTLPENSPRVLVLGGDGRFLVPEVTQKIIALACACNKISHLVIGARGLLSTPAASNLIRKRAALGGIILTASHNPGGPDHDFGIKFNSSNGGPACESITEAIYAHSCSLTSYYIADIAKIPLDAIGVHTLTKNFQVEIIDPVSDYVDLMKHIFSFSKIRNMLTGRKDFSVLFDGMNGVAGPYAQRILVEELGLPVSSLMNCDPLPNFGGGHPDPNLTYAKGLVEKAIADKVDLGAASDGDGDRNMIIGSGGAFVCPCDSVAIIAEWAQRAIPYFAGGLRGVARSMPTTRALDVVARALGVPFFEVPTGWKFFGSLMDAGMLSLCGEESFGTGADHIREKDGLWAVLAWLSILATAFEDGSTNISVANIQRQHFSRFGRHYFARLDYEDVDSLRASGYMGNLRSLINKLTVATVLRRDCVVETAGDFDYTDPIDGSRSLNQGLFVNFVNKSRLVFRLSGTGALGATIRVYMEKFELVNFDGSPTIALTELTMLFLEWTKFEAFIGRDKPTVVT